MNLIISAFVGVITAALLSAHGQIDDLQSRIELLEDRAAIEDAREHSVAYDRMAAGRAAWVTSSTEAERVRVLGPTAQRRLDARAGQ